MSETEPFEMFLDLYHRLFLAREKRREVEDRSPTTIYCLDCDEIYVGDREASMDCELEHTTLMEAHDQAQISAWIDCLEHLEEIGVIEQRVGTVCAPVPCPECGEIQSPPIDPCYECGHPDVETFEALAELEHEQWVEWSKSIAEEEEISDERLERWEAFWVPYDELDEETKEHDRERARRALRIVNDDV